MKLINPNNGKTLQEVNGGLQDDEGNFFELKNGAYRMVSKENYTSSFGYQWNKFAKTQIDRFNDNLIQSSERFWKETNWNKEDLKDKNILEVGSGAGRFTQVMLNETLANIYSVDFSNAVEANYRNNGSNERLKIIQASIYELPFEKKQFDYVLCLGVLQHTPDFEASIKCLCDMVKPGGILVVDFYEKRHFLTKLHAKYLFRPFTKKISQEKLLNLIEKYSDKLIALYRFLSNNKMHILTRFIPICDIKNTLPKQVIEDKKSLKEWVILDTFDMLSPEYDYPQTIKTVTQWVKQNNHKINFSGHIKLSSGKAAVVRSTQ